MQASKIIVIWNYRLVCIFVLLLCSNKAAKSVAQTIHNQRASLGNHIILSSNDNKSARTKVDQRLPQSSWEIYKLRKMLPSIVLNRLLFSVNEKAGH